MGKPAGEGVSSRDPVGYLAIAAAAILWAIAAVAASSLIDRGVAPIELAASRSVIAMLGLALLPAAWRSGRGSAPVVAIFLGLSIALVNTVYYQALARIDVAVALVLQYTAPALVVLWMARSERRPPDRDVLLSLGGAFLGVVLVSEIVSGVQRIDGVGIAFGLAAAVFFSSYTLLSERAGVTYGVIGALFRGFIAASMFWVVYFIPRGFPSELVAPANLGWVLFVGIAGTFAPFLLYLWGVQRVRSERAAIAATLEPIAAAVIAWVWLGQHLSVLQVIGGALILMAVLSLQRSRREPLIAPEP